MLSPELDPTSRVESEHVDTAASCSEHFRSEHQNLTGSLNQYKHTERCSVMTSWGSKGSWELWWNHKSESENRSIIKINSEMNVVKVLIEQSNIGSSIIFKTVIIYDQYKTKTLLLLPLLLLCLSFRFILLSVNILFYFIFYLKTFILTHFLSHSDWSVWGRSFSVTLNLPAPLRDIYRWTTQQRKVKAAE